MKKEAIILAGGFGTRLKDIIKDVPKSMAEIKGKPFLCYLLDYLAGQKIQKVILAVGYKHESISGYFGAKYKNIDIIYSIEDKPLGTGGAVLKALNLAQSNDVFVFNGDTFFDVDLSKLYSEYIQKQADIEAALKPMSKFDRYGTVEISDDFRIKAFYEKEYKEQGLINGGVYIINKNIFNNKGFGENFSFEKDFLENWFKECSFYASIFDNYFIDIGVPQDYEKAKNDL
ncbi:nucleotidyltransferase family protein [bacterium]